MTASTLGRCCCSHINSHNQVRDHSRPNPTQPPTLTRTLTPTPTRTRDGPEATGEKRGWLRRFRLFFSKCFRAAENGFVSPHTISEYQVQKILE